MRNRSGPYLLTAAALLLLVVVLPTADQATPGVVVGADPAQEVTASAGGEALAGAGAAAGGQPVPGGGRVAGGGAGVPGSGVAAAGSDGDAALAEGPASVGASGQEYDELGRPLTGDRSGCAPGGLVQQDVTPYGPPCIPRFEGDNGGATYQGVTEDTITVVMWRQYSSPEQERAGEEIGLSSTTEGDLKAVAAYDNFFNDRYEFYGRRVNTIVHIGDCAEQAPTCFRNEARVVAEKYKPFFVYAQGAMNQAMSDELAKLRIPHTGGFHFTQKWNLDRRPYHWAYFMDSDQMVFNSADYWCKRMHGKTADLAGDPLFRTQRRKLGIVSTEDPEYLEPSKKLQALVSGEVCGSPADRPPLLTISTEAARAQEQGVAVTAALKEEGVTSVIATNGYVMLLLSRNFDQQSYFPEHVIIGHASLDHDIFSRLFSPTQWRNAFGISGRPQEVPNDQQENVTAYRDGCQCDGEPPYVSTAWFTYIHVMMTGFQWAGPNLNPLTFERGMLTGPQLNGWEYTKGEPWEGWRCCTDQVMWNFDEGDYTAVSDSMHVYWDPSAPSPIDGKPGRYFCVEGGRRFVPGGWTPGEPGRLAGDRC